MRSNALPLLMPSIVMIFGSTIFVSAFLIFVVQPMFAKMVLPTLGGSAAVWNTAMLFFQTTLVLGYGYVHFIRSLRVSRQILAHIAILLIACSLLPFDTSGSGVPQPGDNPVFWMLGIMTLSVGLPFFALAANAPLLQFWFSKTKHPRSSDPYFLYSASNLGSILALVLYPLVIEPNLGLKGQSLSWSVVYGLLVAAISGCGVLLWFNKGESSEGGAEYVKKLEQRTTWLVRARWIALALAPSSLMLGVTAHITTDIAAVPLLWILPLSVYLLTFVIVFSRHPWVHHRWMVKCQPFIICILVMTVWGHILPAFPLIVLNLLIFFVTAMMCHGELVRLRPQTDDLTEFYLCIAVGGMLGGAFNALLAPLLFDHVFEYAIALVFACALRPAMATKPGPAMTHKDLLYPTLVLAAAALPVIFFEWRIGTVEETGILRGILVAVLLIIVSLCAYSFKDYPIRYALGVATILIISNVLISSTDEMVAAERSFFGVHKVRVTENQEFNYLIHGSTVHGAQNTNPQLWSDPLMYYHREGPAGDLFSGANLLSRVGVLGLGTGAMSCYRREGQDWTFFEIDPVVQYMAVSSGHFRYLETCAPNAEIVLGDARVSLSSFGKQEFNMLIVDAFASDSVPVHLITSEAIDLYLDKLSSSGLIVFHISNRYMDFEAVLATLGKAKHLTVLAKRGGDSKAEFKTVSHWVAMAKEKQHLEFLMHAGNWKVLLPASKSRVWTDEYSNIIGVITWLKLK